MESPGGNDETDGSEELVDLGDLSIDEPSIEEGPVRHIERTRATLAYLLFGLLAALTGVLLFMLWTDHLTPEEFGTVAAIVTTPIIGLLGAATGYYYGSVQR